MSFNVMNEYIKIAQKGIYEYMKLILENKYERAIVKEFLESYMEIRYYDLNEGKKNKEIKNDILENLEIKKEKLVKEHPEKEITIFLTERFFRDLLYLDHVIPYKNIDRVISHIYEKRKKLLKKENEDFKDILKEKIENNELIKHNYLDKFESREFYLKISNYNSLSDVYRVNLKHNFRISLIYSNYAIEKAFNTGITNEDKLFVEYYLISTHIIKDILKSNFKKIYIVEFAETLLAKKQKLERVLNIIHNSAIQDKLCLKIKHSTYKDNKLIIHDLMREGFRFAVILDDTFDLKYEPLEKLEMFKYIIMNSDFKYYYEVLDNECLEDRIIKI